MATWPEEDLRRRVSAGGGRASISTEELLGGFGVRRATPSARRNIEAWLAEAGLAVEPSLGANGLPEEVTLVQWPPPAAVEPEPVEAEPVEAEPQREPEAVEPDPEAVEAEPEPRAEPEPVEPDPEPPQPEPEPAAPPEPAPSPAVAVAEPVAAPHPEPAVVATSPRRERSPRRELIRKRVSTFLFVLGVLMITEATITVAWQEPLSAFLQSRSQDTLERDLQQIERTPVNLDAQKRAELKKIRNGRKRLKRRLDLLATELSVKAGEGSAIGRLAIDRIDLNAVVVQGVSDASLRKAPGHYKNTFLPGQGGTMGIAGHRTSYGAPFRHLDKLKAGDRVTVTMPYGRFVYRVQGRKIVGAGDTEAFRPVTYQRLVLSACHPLYSASQRILVFARLETRTPLGAGAVDEQRGQKMVRHVDPNRRYRRQLRRLGRRELALGSKGDAVKELQRLLGLPRSGSYDAITAYAVRQFQQEHKLPADGVAGTTTKRLLARRPRPPSRPPTPPPVAPAPPTPQQRGQRPGRPGAPAPGSPPPAPGQQPPG